MPVSLKNTPYIFTIKTFYYAGRRMTRLVQIAGRVGELGRVYISKTTNHYRHEYKNYPSISHFS